MTASELTAQDHSEWRSRLSSRDLRRTMFAVLLKIGDEEVQL